ncbi:hypothetical protein B0H12DRAFT_1245183 [Mycena haematopus]|nr:hypothetical protein B0H12DRAFT_1245183 [Mycena haematopus]
MDHFTIPDGAMHIRGWTEDQLMGRNGFGDRTAAEVEAFFQTWLYFGTLISVFELNGINVDPAEFTSRQSGQVVVTTAEALPRRLRDWRMKGNRDADSKAAEKTVALIEKSGHLYRPVLRS